MYISIALALVAIIGAMFAYLNLRASVDLAYFATDQGNAIIRSWYYVLIAAMLAALLFGSIAIIQWTRTHRRTTLGVKQKDQA